MKSNDSVKKEIERLYSHSRYEMLKTYLDDEIFTNTNMELKIGYLIINGIFRGNHHNDFNNDKNLQNLDFMILSETWLTSKDTLSDINEKLSNWEVFQNGGRQDYDDVEHMAF